ncbi:MAG: xanthine dehydrogenase family protein molybdopterin-binding subunit, partial [Alphaproteobacteria bacterium]
TYTVLSQIAAEQFGMSMDDVTVHLGDSSLPTAYVEGGSVTAASSGTAIQLACLAIKEKLFKQSKHDSFKGVDPIETIFRDGSVALKRTPAETVTIASLMEAAGLDEIEEMGKAGPDVKQMLKYISYTHSAVFVEVRVDEQLGVVRIKRVVSAIAAGRILNPKTARSQILGGVVMGIGMALHEESLWDHGTGRIMNHNLAEYHVPAHADIEDIEVIFVNEEDELVNDLGIKGLGEIGIVGVPAAISNAIFHATGKRLRDLPITIDKIIAP